MLIPSTSAYVHGPLTLLRSKPCASPPLLCPSTQPPFLAPLNHIALNYLGREQEKQTVLYILEIIIF